MSTMRKPLRNPLRVLFAAIAFLPAMALSESAPEAAAPEAPKKSAMSQDVGDSADAIKNYSAAQKEEAEKKAKATLDDVDARISELEARVSKNWSSMNQAARDHAHATLAGVAQEAQRGRRVVWRRQA